MHALDVRIPVLDAALSTSPLAASVVLAFSALLMGGISESMRVNLTITALNLAIILFIIVAGTCPTP
jgi:amino acid transporter